jgi:hypothetical protein
MAGRTEPGVRIVRQDKFARGVPHMNGAEYKECLVILEAGILQDEQACPEAIDRKRTR